MKASERRSRIRQVLTESQTPLTGSDLAARFDVSRQVIVQDIALLRASGEPILATSQGYMLTEPGSGLTRVIACVHSREETADELNTMVDFGAEVIDVIVEHPLYGQLSGILMLKSRLDVARFIEKLEVSGAGLLSSLTDGLHLHTIRITDEEAYETLLERLNDKGYLLKSS